jgi:hypothetical protein
MHISIRPVQPHSGNTFSRQQRQIWPLYWMLQAAHGVTSLLALICCCALPVAACSYQYVTSVASLDMYDGLQVRRECCCCCRL